MDDKHEEETIEELEDFISTFNKYHELFKSGEIERKFKALQSKIGKLKASEKMNNELHEIVKENEKLKAEINKANQDNLKMKAEVNIAKQKMARMEDEYHADVEKLKQQGKKDKSKITELEQKVIELQRIVDHQSINHSSDNNKKDIEKLKAENYDLCRDTREKEQKIKELNKKIKILTSPKTNNLKSVKDYFANISNCESKDRSTIKKSKNNSKSSNDQSLHDEDLLSSSGDEIPIKRVKISNNSNENLPKNEKTPTGTKKKILLCNKSPSEAKPKDQLLGLRRISRKGQEKNDLQFDATFDDEQCRFKKLTAFGQTMQTETSNQKEPKRAFNLKLQKKRFEEVPSTPPKAVANIVNESCYTPPLNELVSLKSNEILNNIKVEPRSQEKKRKIDNSASPELFNTEVDSFFDFSDLHNKNVNNCDDEDICYVPPTSPPPIPIYTISDTLPGEQSKENVEKSPDECFSQSTSKYEFELSQEINKRKLIFRFRKVYEGECDECKKYYDKKLKETNVNVVNEDLRRCEKECKGYKLRVEALRKNPSKVSYIHANNRARQAAKENEERFTPSNFWDLRLND